MKKSLALALCLLAAFGFWCLSVFGSEPHLYAAPKGVEMEFSSYPTCKTLTVKERGKTVMIVGDFAGVRLHEGHWAISIPWVAVDELARLRPQEKE